MEVLVLCARVSPGGSGRKGKLSPTLLWEPQNLVMTVLQVATFTHSIILLHNQ